MPYVSYTHLIFVMVYKTEAHSQDVPITELIFGMMWSFLAGYEYLNITRLFLSCRLRFKL